MELRLLHYFTTRTYKTISTEVAADQEFWQHKVPELALEHEFLLYALLALASFQIASSATHEQHTFITLGLEYQGQALQGCRTALSDDISQVKDAVFYFSLILMILALASSQFVTVHGPGSMVENTITHIELLRGVFVMMPSDESNPEWANTWSKVEGLISEPGKPLDGGTQALLDRLAAASTFENLPGRDNSLQAAQDPGNPFGAAIHWLGYLLAECGDLLHSAAALGWPELAGHDFVVALQARNKIALLILVMWTMSLRELEKHAWWAKNFGSSLVKELSAMMADDNDQLVVDVFLWVEGENKEQ